MVDQASDSCNTAAARVPIWLPRAPTSGEVAAHAAAHPVVPWGNDGQRNLGGRWLLAYRDKPYGLDSLPEFVTLRVSNRAVEAWTGSSFEDAGQFATVVRCLPCTGDGTPVPLPLAPLSYVAVWQLGEWVDDAKSLGGLQDRAWSNGETAARVFRNPPKGWRWHAALPERLASATGEATSAEEAKSAADAWLTERCARC